MANRKKQKYIVWSFDETESQTFADIVLATSPAGAARRVSKGRPYATLDAYVAPMLLSAHIKALTRELESGDDNFEDYVREEAK